jgi:hypothetical protein
MGRGKGAAEKMIYNLIIKEEASAEIKVAFLYYQQQIEGLGIRFIQELELHLNSVHENPFHYSYFLGEKPFRSHALQHFPFSIIYEATEKDVIVFSIFHQYQNPTKLSKRLK